MFKNSGKNYIKDSDNVIFGDQISRQIKKLSAYLSRDKVYLLILDRDISSVLSYLALLSSKCTFIITDSERPSLISQLCMTHHLQNVISSSKINHGSIASEDVIEIDSFQQIYLYRTNCPSITSEDGTFLINNPSILITTSGSTSTSKLVRLSYENLEANTAAIAQSLDINKNDRGISVLPLSYTYGLSVLNMHLYQGASFILTSKSAVEEEFWNILKDESITNLAGVPFSYELYQRIGLDNVLPSTLRFTTQAGGKLDLSIQKDILEYCNAKSIDFYIMYGQTEATARISCFKLNQYPDKIGSVGKSLANLSVKTSNDGEISELRVDGPSISTGYASNFTDLLKPHFKRTLMTGDLAEIDKDGFIFIRGRISRFAKISGIRICLETIENEIQSAFGLEVYVVTDDRYIYIASTSKVVARDIKSIVKVHPSKIKLVELPDIPRTSSGKVSYAKIKSICTK